jgi:hypothetical protein
LIELHTRTVGAIANCTAALCHCVRAIGLRRTAVTQPCDD